MVSKEFSNIAQKVLREDEREGLRGNKLLGYIRQSSDLESWIEREVIQRIIISKIGNDITERYVNLGNLWGRRDLVDVIEELEKLGCVWTSGRLYTNAYNFYLDMFRLKVGFFIDTDYCGPDNMVIVRAIIRIPPGLVAADRSVKPIYRECMERELQCVFKDYDVLNVDYVENDPDKWKHTILPGVYEMRAVLRVKEKKPVGE